MRELRTGRPVLLEGEDIDGTSRQFRGWRIEVIHLGRGPIARCGAVIPFDDMRISLVQVRRATILRGITPDDELSLLSTSPSSPPVRVGSRPIDSGVCLMLGAHTEVEIYLPENCCAFMLSLPSRTNGATTRLSAAPAKGQAEFRALAAEHSALLNKCMDLLEAFRRSSAPKVIATQVQLRLRELLAPEIGRAHV